jgi:multidrug transporter EmrE-like cation transporter
MNTKKIKGWLKKTAGSARYGCQKAVIALAMFFYSAGVALATSKGAGGFSKATTEISSYQEPVSNLMKAIAAVIVLVGAFNVYFKMQNGDQDVKKTIMLTIGGCVAFIAMSEALPLFFK